MNPTLFGRVLIVALTMLLSVRALYAHDLGVAHVELEELAPGHYYFEAKISGVDAPAPPVFPPRFAVAAVSPSSGPIESGSRIFAWETLAPDGSLRSDESLTLPWASDGAFVSSQWLDGSQAARFFPFRSGGTPVAISALGGDAPPLLQTARQYIFLGVEHILSGWDHLAFLVAIFLLVAGRKLALWITGFTLGHSITLVAAALDWVNIPAPPIEAAIALSIVLLAIPALKKEPEVAHGFWIICGFGLLHGLGFAGALSEIGIPRSELIAGLVSFNLGVEIGQLLFVSILAAVVFGVRSVLSKRAVSLPLRPAIALGIALCGTFWTIERVLSFSQ